MIKIILVITPHNFLHGQAVRKVKRTRNDNSGVGHCTDVWLRIVHGSLLAKSTWNKYVETVFLSSSHHPFRINIVLTRQMQEHQCPCQLSVFFHAHVRTSKDAYFLIQIQGVASCINCWAFEHLKSCHIPQKQKNSSLNANQMLIIAHWYGWKDPRTQGDTIDSMSTIGQVSVLQYVERWQGFEFILAHFLCLV